MKQRLIPLAALGLFALLTMGFSLYQIGRSSASAHAFAGTEVRDPPDLSGLSLVGDDGTARGLESWAGETLLVFFGFTHCPDVCPLTMAYLAGLYQDLGEPGDLQVVMITVDPARDSPEVMRDYVSGFHPDFAGLTGSAEAITQAASRFYIGHQRGADGMVIHTDVVLLVDRQGRMRYVYNQDNLSYLEEDLAYVLATSGW
ncbi:SCO family protein [soil metagenome]|jgi:protein SCO1/2|nr:SCO family protein [Deinococcota bacterium]